MNRDDDDECHHDWHCWTVGDTLYCECRKCGLVTEDESDDSARGKGG